MKNRLWIVLWAMCAVACTVDAALWDRINIKHSRQVEQAPTIRVLVLDDAPNAVLEVKGKYMILDAQGCEYSSRVHGKCRLIEASPSGLTWGEIFLDRFKITLVPTSKDSVMLVNGTPYRGSLTIQGFKDSPTLSIVNTVDVEHYLASVLGAQLNQAYPSEVLHALAIVERTRVYNQKHHTKEQEHWDVDAQKVGYVGANPSSMAHEVNRALAATRYMVLGKAGASSEDVVLVPIRWQKEEMTKKGVLSLIDASQKADAGQHAGQILGEIAPNTAIVRIFP